MTFKKGKSGNPNGRPKVDNAFRDACRKHAPKALKTMVELMTSDDERVKSDACKWIVERGYGKAPQPVTGEDGGPQEHVVRHEMSAESRSLMDEVLSTLREG